MALGRRSFQTLQVEGLRDILLMQGGSVKADAEAGIDAWQDSLAFLAAATKLLCPVCKVLKPMTDYFPSRVAQMECGHRRKI